MDVATDEAEAREIDEIATFHLSLDWELGPWQKMYERVIKVLTEMHSEGVMTGKQAVDFPYVSGLEVFLWRIDGRRDYLVHLHPPLEFIMAQYAADHVAHGQAKSRFVLRTRRDPDKPALTEMWRNLPGFGLLHTQTVQQNLTIVQTPSSLPIMRRHLPLSVLKVALPWVSRINTQILMWQI